MARAKQFVFNAQQLLPLDGKVSAARKAHWLATSCSVKRFGYRGAPVDNNGLSRNIGNSQTADMKAFDLIRVVHLSIDSPKDECRIAQIKMGEALQQLFVEQVALVTCLESAARAGLIEIANAPGVGLALFEARVGMVDMGLFGSEVGVVLAHFGV